MTRRYLLVLYIPDRNAGAWRAAPLGRFRTIERALRRSEAVLRRHPSVETRSGPRDRFGYFCSLHDTKQRIHARGVVLPLAKLASQDDADRLAAPVELVASVGELGWTP